jgi:hypothetical protein
MIPSREVCRICWHENPIGFTVPDAVWTAVVPGTLRRHVICIACFARLADARLVVWEEEIQLFPVSRATHLALAWGLTRPDNAPTFPGQDG